MHVESVSQTAMYLVKAATAMEHKSAHTRGKGSAGRGRMMHDSEERCNKVVFGMTAPLLSRCGVIGGVPCDSLSAKVP